MTAALTGLFDSDGWCWDAPLLAASGAAAGQLPDIRPADRPGAAAGRARRRPRTARGTPGRAGRHGRTAGPAWCGRVQRGHRDVHGRDQRRLPGGGRGPDPGPGPAAVVLSHLEGALGGRGRGQQRGQRPGLGGPVVRRAGQARRPAPRRPGPAVRPGPRVPAVPQRGAQSALARRPAGSPHRPGQPPQTGRCGPGGAGRGRRCRPGTRGRRGSVRHRAGRGASDRRLPPRRRLAQLVTDALGVATAVPDPGEATATGAAVLGWLSLGRPAPRPPSPARATQERSPDHATHAALAAKSAVMRDLRGLLFPRP